MGQVNTKNLQYIRQKDSKLGEALDSHATALSNISQQLALDPNGATTSPSAIGSVNAIHLGVGHVDFSLVDNSPRFRALNYFFEYLASGSSVWRTVPMGPSRSTHPIVLPNGTYQTRGYSQYPAGGPPSAPVYGPTIKVTGSSTGTLLSSQGSGTGNATQSGQGAGVALTTSTGSGRNPVLR